MPNRQLLATLMFIGAFSLPAYADRGSSAYKHGQKAERKKEYDDAFTSYKQAYTAVPNNPAYLGAYTRMRFMASAEHVHKGELLVKSGALTQALAEFQRAVEIDTSSFMAQQELRTTAELLRRQERQRLAPKTEPSTGKAVEFGEILELKPLSEAAITLHLTVNSDQAYKTICKLAGINVVFDPDFRPQKITVDLTDVTLREALDMVRLQSKTFWRPVLPGTIFVTSDSPAKRKELEQNVMKTFYLKNVSTPAELQEAANVVRQMIDVNRVQLLAQQDAMILRGTPDQMVLAEKLLADIDKPKSEVVIDVAVMQVSRDRLRTIGMAVPTSTSAALFPTAAAAASAAGSAGFQLSNFVIAQPGAVSFSFLATDSNSKIIQNPQIRALNDQKATLRIGDRVPIATGSFQPGIVGGGGVSPLVSTQFQYLDVGVNIDITPHIHSNQEVTLKMALEISSVTGTQSIGGITQPIIGQRRVDLETRVVDGDVNLLGGILNDSETQSMSGYPWVSKIPLLKYLFAQENKQRNENEVIFAITPHIVRAKDVTEDNLRTIEVGTGSAIELRRKAPAPAAPASDHQAVPAKSQQSGPQASVPSTAVPAPPSPGGRPQAGPQGKPGGSQ